MAVNYPTNLNKRGRLTGQKHAWALHAGLIALSALFLFPLVWLVSTALKTDSQTMSQHIQWIPRPFEWSNFRKAYAFFPFFAYAINTVLVAILSVAGAVVSNSLVAYAFARLRWKGRDIAFAITVATMMVPFPVTMVPIYGLFKSLGWIGTFRPLWIGFWFGGAFNIFLLRQFFRTIPFELSEAARIDGCSEWEIFRLVILPLARPALAVVALFTFLGTWNDFLGPLIYLTSQKSFTLGLGLQFFQNQHGGTFFNLQMAATVMVITPVIVLFFFAQKQFIQGIAVTGLKG